VQFKNVGYIPFMVFDGYANHGNLACRWLVEKLIDRLLPEPLIRLKAPAMTEASVLRQGRRMVVHVLHYSPQRRTPTLDIVEDVVPLMDVEISLKMERKPVRVYLAPERKALEFNYSAGRARVVVSRVDGHAMVVFE
jgi:hypothetical protein